jgi:glycosyltransferase involved in cell wall biosynthesis
MKNVLIFGMTDKQGGIESFLLNYCFHMDPARFSFDFLCNTKTVAYEQELIDHGCKVYRIAMRSQNRKQYQKELRAFFDAHGKEYDIIWVNVCSLANIDYLKEAKRVGIPVRIIHSHNSANMDSKLRGMLHKLNKTQIEKYATYYFSCSKEASDWFYTQKIQSSGRYYLINNAIDVSKYAYDPQIALAKRKELGLEDNFVVGNIGRFHFQKNQLFLLDIFEEIKKRKENAKLLLVGDGEDRDKIEEAIAKKNLQDSVMLLSFRKDVPALLMAMDVFVFPSLFEGLSLALLEAQASGLPVFASKDVISKDSSMSDSFYWISLEKPAEEWAEQIVQKSSESSHMGICKLEQFGYDIQKEAKKLEELFEGFL